MQANEGYRPRKCSVCGDPKTEMRDGHEVILRCDCDYKRGVYERLVRTLHSDLFKKTPMDWKPPLFQRPCNFPALIKAQQVAALLMLYDFTFKPAGKRGTEQRYAIHRSVEKGRNLFIRGPQHSGRGLLMSVVKKLAAGKNLSLTPLPGDFDVFRSEVSQSEALGASGDAIRAQVRANYVDVDILALENLRQESQFRITGDKTRKKFRGANVVDDILARRRMKQGSMVFTSYDFAGEIADTLGDNLADVLSSPNTSLILLFSPAEADSLLAALRSRKKSLHDVLKTVAAMGGEKAALPDKQRDEQNLEYLRDALYFNEAFGVVDASIPMLNDVEVLEKKGKLHQRALKVLADFRAAKEANDATHAGKKNQAYAEAARGAFNDKMTERELEATGRLMSLAMSKQWFDSLVQKAKACRAEMSDEDQD